MGWEIFATGQTGFPQKNLMCRKSFNNSNEWKLGPFLSGTISTGRNGIPQKNLMYRKRRPCPPTDSYRPSLLTQSADLTSRANRPTQLANRMKRSRFPFSLAVRTDSNHSTVWLNPYRPARLSSQTQRTDPSHLTDPNRLNHPNISNRSSSQPSRIKTNEWPITLTKPHCSNRTN